MAEKLLIEIYKNKNCDELSKEVADAGSRLQTGSGISACASMAAAIACRGAVSLPQDNERCDYLRRNFELIRKYMVELIDKDVQCRAPLRRARKEGGEREIEASLRAAVSIQEEIVCMMSNLIDLIDEACNYSCGEDKYMYQQASQLAMGVMNSARYAILSLSDLSVDDTYRFVTRRENEITIEQNLKKVTGIAGRLGF